MSKVKYTLTAVVPVAQYANLQPAIEVEADSIEDAEKQVLPYIESFFNKYSEKHKIGAEKRAASPDRLLLKDIFGNEIFYDDKKHEYSNALGEVYLSGSQFAKEEEFDSVINVNLKGTFNTTQQVSSIMLKQKSGTIINLSSVVGLTGNAGQANYAASKAGVIGLTKSVARELASRGITCNAIAPGFIETDMTDVLSDKVKEATIASIPLKKLGQVEDIAKAAVFLATNKYITGQVINVDGGMVMNG